MDYPATQMFVNEDEEDQDDAGTPLRTDKNIKIGILVTDLDTYPVHRGVNKIGRINSCSVVIDHNTISKEHAEIEAGTGSKSIFISDLGSLNKTKLNDAVLRPGRLYQLQNGDVLRFGSVKAVFKVEKNKTENSLGRSKEHINFVIPETPLPVAKGARLIVSATPDNSFERSTMEMNRSSDVSLIAGTEEVENVGGKLSPRLSREPFSLRGSPRSSDLNEEKKNTSQMNKNQDIAEFEDQKDVSIDDSDEENIFDMLTQQSDIHDEETQRFSADKVQTVVPARFTVDRIESQSINDLETQKFGNDDQTDPRTCSINDLETQKFPVDSRSYSINDLETQKFPVDRINSRSYSINDLETQKFPVDQINSRSYLINDLETQKFPVDNVTSDAPHVTDKTKSSLCSIHDVETQKPEALNKNDEDSETDEEGIFEDSGDMVDMFDAPTQLIRAPREASQSPRGTPEKRDNDVRLEKVEAEPREDEIIQKEAAKDEGLAQVLVQNETPDIEPLINDKPRAELNDSIESKLNHMFDDVNDAGLDEPTQMLTQHLEKILDTTQNDEPELRREAENIPNPGNVDPGASKVADRNRNRIIDSSSESDDDNIAKSDNEERNEPSKEVPKKSPTPIPEVPEIMSSQELFDDLPAVVILGTSSAEKEQAKTKTLCPSDVVAVPRSKRFTKSKSRNSEAAKDVEAQKVRTGRSDSRNRSNGSKRAGSTESVDSKKDLKRLKSVKNSESGVAESRAEAVEEIIISPKASGRNKPKTESKDVPNISYAKNLEETITKLEESVNPRNRKGLPLKKRGSSIIADPPTVVEVVSTARVSTRSNIKIPVETGKRSSRLSDADRPKVPETKRRSSMMRVNYNKPESPTPVLPDENETLNRNKKATRSRRIIADTSSTDLSPKIESVSRRLRNKPLDSSNTTSEEEVTPVKRPRMSKTVLPVTVNDPPRPVASRVKRKIPNSRDANVSESYDSEINPNASPSTRSRRGRPAGNKSSTDDSRDSSLGVEPLDNAVQSSLESQEIQAILGVVDQRGKDSGVSRDRKMRIRFHCPRTQNNHKKDAILGVVDQKVEDSGVSLYRKEMRRRFHCPRVVNSAKKDAEEDVKGFMGFPKTERPEEAEEDRFEKPVGIPERKKRQPRQPQLDATANNDHETSIKRPKTRGKKIADVVNEDLVPKGESSGVTAAEKTGQKKEPKNSPSPVNVAEAATPKSRTNARGASRRTVDRAEKENVVEETAPKRGRRRSVSVKLEKPNSAISSDDEVNVSRISSPLRRGRSCLSTPSSAASSSTKLKHKILFTGLNDPQLIAIVHNLGGTVTEKPNDCTALVTDKVRRTYKFLCGMAMAVPIVSVHWLKESERNGRFLDTGDFLLDDPVEEAKFKFNLRQSLVKATGNRLLEGYTVVLTPNTAPPPIAEMKGIIQACGGKALVRAPTTWPEKSLIISRPEDVKNAKKYSAKAPKSVRVLSVEFILTGILRHELNFEEHELETT